MSHDGRRKLWRWAAITAGLVLFVFLAGRLLTSSLLYPDLFAGDRDQQRVRALLEQHAAAFAGAEEQQACKLLWRASPGSAGCARHLRWVREQAPSFTGKLRVLRVTSDASRTQLTARVTEAKPNAATEYDVVLLISCSQEHQVVGPSCPLWITGIDKVPGR